MVNACAPTVPGTDTRPATCRRHARPSRTWSLPRAERSARTGRALVRTVLTAWRLDDLTDDATVLVSELIGNAVEHTASDHVQVTVTRTRRDTVRIAVTDGSRTLPVRRDPDDTADRGRGLLLVEALSRRWGVDAQPRGKRVWGELTGEPHH